MLHATIWVKEHAWLACFIDSEGTVSLNKSHRVASLGTWLPKRGFIWSPKLNLVNTCKPMLEEAFRITSAGLLSKHDFTKYNRNTKPIYRLNFRPSEIPNILRDILPFLIAKKEQASLLLEALEIRSLYRPGDDDEIMSLRDKRLEAIYWQMRLLNSRGSHGAEDVLKEIASIPHDPRLFTRDAFDKAYEAMWDQVKDARYENRLRISREWKARNRDRMHAYWDEWYAKRKAALASV